MNTYDKKQLDESKKGSLSYLLKTNEYKTLKKSRHGRNRNN